MCDTTLSVCMPRLPALFSWRHRVIVYDIRVNNAGTLQCFTRELFPRPYAMGGGGVRDAGYALASCAGCARWPLFYLCGATLRAGCYSSFSSRAPIGCGVSDNCCRLLLIALFFLVHRRVDCDNQWQHCGYLAISTTRKKFYFWTLRRGGGGGGVQCGGYVDHQVLGILHVDRWPKCATLLCSRLLALFAGHRLFFWHPEFFHIRSSENIRVRK